AQVGARLRPLRRLQSLLEEAGRQLHHVGQAGALLLAPLGLLVARRQGDAGHLGHALDRLGKAQAVKLGQELEMVARDAAAETVIAALAVLAMEGRRLLAMERAAAPVVAALGVGLPPVPRHARADDGRNRHAVAYLVEKGRGKSHRPASSGAHISTDAAPRDTA